MNEYIDRVIARLKIGWTRLCYARRKSDQEPVLLADAPNLGDDCEYCLTGAMIVEDPLKGGTPDSLMARLEKRIHSIIKRGVADWNDHYAKDLNHVISVLEKCKDAA